MHRLKFFTKSINDLKTVGSVIPSSAAAAKKMADPVDFDKAEALVELGAGTGPVTKELLKRMKPKTRLFVFEKKPEFAEVIRNFNDPRVTVINDSAEKLEHILGSYGIGKVDAVVSTLPLALMEKQVKEKIYSAISKVLKPDSPYVQIQYSLLSRKELKKNFSKVRLRFTIFNLPPCFFYTCWV